MLSTINSKIVIALDAMGGDFAPLSVIQGADFFLTKLLDTNVQVSFRIYGDQQKVLPILSRYSRLENNSEFIHCHDNVLADDKPSFALRRRTNSSMRAAVEAVKQKKSFWISVFR